MQTTQNRQAVTPLSLAIFDDCTYSVCRYTVCRKPRKYVLKISEKNTFKLAALRYRHQDTLL